MLLVAEQGIFLYITDEVATMRVTARITRLTNIKSGPFSEIACRGIARHPPMSYITIASVYTKWFSYECKDSIKYETSGG